MKLCNWMIFALMLISAEANDCTTFSGLMELILTTDDNLYHLNDMFYPPRDVPPTFVDVTYHFKERSNISNVLADTMSYCNVTYIWAEGGFLLIQPPSIFQLTSLLFNQVELWGENEEKLLLSLPWQCRILVQMSNNSNCACDGSDDGARILDLATQQVTI